MKKYIVALVVGIGLMANGPTFGVEGAYTAYGGTESCKTVTAYLDDSFRHGWVMGWVSGINAAQKLNWSRAPSAHDIWDEILVYCVKNPQDDLRDAAEMVYVEFLNKSI